MSHPGKDLLAGCVDGELAENDYDRVQAHLARCTRCQHELVALKQTSTKLQLLDDPEFPNDLTSKLLAMGMSADRSWLTAECAADTTVGPLRPDPVPPASGSGSERGRSADDGTDTGLV